MDENNFKGAARDLGGKMQEVVGDFTGDSLKQARGKFNQAAGEAQEAYGSAVDQAKSFTSDQPMMALLTAMGIGVILGFSLGRR